MKDLKEIWKKEKKVIIGGSAALILGGIIIARKGSKIRSLEANNSNLQGRISQLEVENAAKQATIEKQGIEINKRNYYIGKLFAQCLTKKNNK